MRNIDRGVEWLWPFVCVCVRLHDSSVRCKSSLRGRQEVVRETMLEMLLDRSGVGRRQERRRRERRHRELWQ